MATITVLTTQNPPQRFAVGETVRGEDGREHEITSIEPCKGGTHYLVHGSGDFERLVLPSECIGLDIEV